MTARLSKFKIIRNPELVRAGRGFVPVFGNATDRNIVDRIISIDKKLETVNNEILRSGNNLTKKMADILFEEIQLIQTITSRNNDF